MKHFYYITALVGLTLSAIFVASKGATAPEFPQVWYILYCIHVAVFAFVCIGAADESK